MQRNLTALVRLVVLLAPWILLLLGSFSPRGGDPWQLLDSKDRLRVRVEEGDNGAFELAFLDPKGEKKLTLGTSGEGGPMVHLRNGKSSLRIAPEGSSEDIALTVDGSTTRLLLTRFGVAVFEGAKTPRVVLNLSEEKMEAEAYLSSRQGKFIALASESERSGIWFEGGKAGIEIAEGKEMIWLGSAPGTLDELKQGDGISLLHRANVASYMSLRAGKGSTRTYIQSSPTSGAGLHVGDEGVDGWLRLGIPPEGGDPAVEAFDKTGAVLWRMPEASK